MRKLSTFLMVGAVSMLVLASSALAAPGDPPSFDASTLSGPLNDFGTAMLAGLVVLIGVVLVIKTPFALIRVGMKAVNRLFGGSKPSVG